MVSLQDRDRYFTDGGVGYNNPIGTIEGRLVDAGLNPKSSRQCYVSIGTGLPADEQTDYGQKEWWREFTFSFKAVSNLKNAATSTRGAHEAFRNLARYRGEGFHYFRFDCDGGLGDMKLSLIYASSKHKTCHSCVTPHLVIIYL